MAISMRSPLTPDDERRIRLELDQHIDSARRGRAAAACEAARCMARLGVFDGPAAARRRQTFALWLEGVHPDVAAEGWARFLASRGGR